MHKQSSKGRKESKEILINNFFSYQRQADILFIFKNTRFSDSKSGIFFCLLFHKIGSVERWETKHFIGMALPSSEKVPAIFFV